MNVVCPVHEPHLSVYEPHLPIPKPRLPILESRFSVPESPLPVSKPRLPVPHILPRPDRRDFVPKLVEDMPKVPEFDARTAADKAIRRGYREHLDRRPNAGRRVEAREARMNKEWEENVQKYGEEEARRRQYEEWQCLKEMERLNTSDVEEMARQDRDANPLITLTIQYHVD